MPVKEGSIRDMMIKVGYSSMQPISYSSMRQTMLINSKRPDLIPLIKDGISANALMDEVNKEPVPVLTQRQLEAFITSELSIKDYIVIRYGINIDFIPAYDGSTKSKKESYRTVQYCLICGKVFRHKARVMITNCSYSCKVEYKALTAPVMVPSTVPCLHCGKEFQQKRSDAKFCSGNCKQTAYYYRHDTK